METKGPRALAAVLAMSLVAAAFVLGACGGDARSSNKTPAAVSTPASSQTAPGATADARKDDEAMLTGAGSTFAGPLYTRWFTDYHSAIAPGVKGNYQAIGSGGGIMNITNKTVDFGATDAPMSDSELAKAPGIQHIPTALGPVVITYNLSGVTLPLKLDGDTLANIYLGKITEWSDPAISAQNAGVTMPDADIIVVHRSDGSGTSYAFTDYLSQVSSEWKSSVGTSKNPQWPEGLGGRGNDGVTQQVRQNANSIGYVELIYADRNNLPKADLKNANGEYIVPSGASTTLAAQGATLPADYRVSIADSKTPGAYPIATFTWILLYQQQADARRGKALVDFLWWAVHDGQATAQQLDYAPLPSSVVRSVEGTLEEITGPDGTPLLRPE